jgi:outer membrane protein
MKKTLIVVLTLLVAASFVYSQTKIGVINPQKVIAETIRGKQVQEKLKKLSDEKQQQIKGMEEKISKLEKDLMSPAINAETRDKKAAQLQNTRTALKRFVEDAQKDFQTEYAKEMQNLTKEIMPVIEKIGSEKGFTIIFDLNNSGISYFDKAIDVTDDVIKAYNAKISSK